MLNVDTLKAMDLKGLSKSAMAELGTQMLAQMMLMSEKLSVQQIALTAKDEHLAQRDREIKFKDAKIERITFELARLKAWKFGARTEAMNVQQRQMFEDTAAEDEADLEAQLQALQSTAEPVALVAAAPRAKPRRQQLPESLRRVEHRHEPENTTCPTPECGQAMVRIGEDVSERLDIVPAEFFVHRHIRGKWACKCCQILVQEPAEPQIIDKGMPTSGLLAHTLVSRFVDHLPYYRQAQINARAGPGRQRRARCVHATPAPACTHRARRWRPGPARLAPACSPCLMRTAPSCLAHRCYMLTRRRSGCWTPAQARPPRPTSGRMRGASTTPCRA
jgi:transposase